MTLQEKIDKILEIWMEEHGRTRVLTAEARFLSSAMFNLVKESLKEVELEEVSYEDLSDKTKLDKEDIFEIGQLDGYSQAYAKQKQKHKEYLGS